MASPYIGGAGCLAENWSSLAAGRECKMEVLVRTLKLHTLAEALVRFAYRTGRMCQSYCERIVDGTVNGWVWKPAAPNQILSVDIYADGRFLATVPADRSRPDLVKAKIGRGNHAFRFPLPASVLDGREREIAVTMSGTHVPLRNSPQPLSVPFEVVVDGIEGNMLTGWAWSPWSADAQPDLEVWESGRVVAQGRADVFLEHFRGVGKGDGRHGFQIPLPTDLLDGEEHTFRVSVAGGGKKTISSSKRIRAGYEGYLDGVDWTRNNIYGWARRPGQTAGASVDISLNGRCVGSVVASLFRTDLRAAGMGNGLIGFEAPLPEPLDPYKSYFISAKISGTDIHLKHSPQYLISPHGVRRALRELCFDLNSLCQARTAKAFARLEPSSIRNDPVSFEYIRQFLFSSLVDSVPSGTTHVAVKGDPASGVPANPFPQADFSSEPVDVIVPVYHGVEATVNCLDSVAAAAVSCPHQVVVIIDDSDRDRYHLVVEVAERHGFTVLFNDENEGFPRTVNRGMRLHADHDVILLNSDTLVFGDWIGRLRRAAYRDPSVGTATPFSNNASICSYPRMCHNNPVTAEEARALDLGCASVNANETVDIPTAVGFCMYIRRNCLVDVGLFEENLWGKGYGEENDFCLRATKRGWRHVLAGDVFVAHIGHASFESEDGDALMRDNGKKLSELYPDYDSTVDAFISTDPPRSLRRRLDLARMRTAGDGYMLLVTLKLAGGAHRYVNDLADALNRRGVATLILRVTAGRLAGIEVAGQSSNLVYALDGELEDLHRDLGRLPIRHVHYQQFIDVPDKILRLARDLGIPYDCTIHDYSCVCPRVTMVDDSTSYCGEPDLHVCEKCITLSGVHPMWTTFGDQYRTVGALRAASSDLLSGARRVFCPDQDVKARLSRYFNPDNLIVRPHLDRLPPFEPLPRREGAGELRVAVIGAVGPHKGYYSLLACARHAFKTRAPIRFVVVGYTCNDKELAAVGNVSITGEYAEREIFDLLRKVHPDIVFFPSVCPETYSYTLSIALHAGLYPVAFDLGSIAARIRGASFGKLIPLTAFPGEIVQALLEAGPEARTKIPPPAPCIEYADILADYYELDEVRAAGPAVQA